MPAQFQEAQDDITRAEMRKEAGRKGGQMYMKWITNSHESTKSEYINALTLGQPTRHIIEGNPKAFEWMSVSDLKRAGMVGLYDA